VRTQDSVAKILEAAPQLNDALMRARLAEYSKFGLPSGGGDGRGGERPLPMLGNTDRAILVARREYEQNLAHAALALDAALRLQNAWCIPRTDDTEKAEKLKAEPLKGAGPCANIWCDHICTGLGNDRLREGRCRPHYRVWKLEGQDRDPRKDLTSLTSKESAV
jgi:hypothetical protein